MPSPTRTLSQEEQGDSPFDAHARRRWCHSSNRYLPHARLLHLREVSDGMCKMALGDQRSRRDHLLRLPHRPRLLDLTPRCLQGLCDLRRVPVGDLPVQSCSHLLDTERRTTSTSTN